MRFTWRGILLLGLAGAACNTPSASVQDILRVGRVEVEPANITVQIGRSVQLTATPKTESGIVITNRQVTWLSNEPTLASVSESGLVTAHQVGGPVQITATVDGIPGAAIITVSPEPITRINVSPAEKSLVVGGSEQFSAVAIDASGNVVPGATFTWRSSAPSLADVTTSGRVVAVAAGGPVTITASNGDISGTASVTVAPPPPTASRLAFTQQPPTGTAGRPLSPAVRVEIRDQNGNPIGDASAQITIRLGSNPGGAALVGTTTLSATNGVATFSDLTLDRVGNGYTLIASSSGLIEATSSPFNVAPASLAIVVQPSTSAISGQPFPQQPAIRVRDAAGNPLSGVVVTASIASGGGTLGGTPTATSDANGLTGFTNLSITGSAGTRTLRFDAPDATGVTSGSINVSPPPPSQLAFTQQPPNGTAGQPLSPPVQVTVQDDNGNPVTSSSAAITVRLGSNPGGASLGGTLTVNATNGVATFSNLVLDQPGSGYTLIASASGLRDATSSPFNIAPVTLIITTQPSATATSGQPFAQQPVISVRNGSGQPLSGIAVTAVIASGGGTLGGTTTVTSNANGFANYTNLSISGNTGTRTLRFEAPAASSVTSNPILVTPPAPAPAQVGFTQQPQNGTVGQPLNAVRVAIQDASGTTIATSSAPVTLLLGNNPGSATLSGTLTVNAVSGIATFSNLVLDRTGTGYTLVASSSGLTGATSAAFSIAPVSLSITTQPSATVPSGQTFPQQPVIRVRNASGSGLGGVAVTVTIASGGGTLGGTATVTSNGSGDAAFTNLSITGTAGDRTLGFAASGATSVTSTPIAVTVPPATQLAILVQPSATAEDNERFSRQPVIQLLDAQGNPVRQSGVRITASIASGPSSGELKGERTADTDNNGVATFQSLRIDGTGTYTLRFGSGNLQPAVSNPIVVEGD